MLTMNKKNNAQEVWKFTKMHGTGNDFIVLDGVNQSIQMTKERARALANRNFGIGADQILLVEVTKRSDADFRYRIFNANGEEVEHCGNGARCFARFVHHQGLSKKNPLRAEIKTGVLFLKENNKEVTVDVGSILFDPKSISFKTNGLMKKIQFQETLWELNFDDFNLSSVMLSIASISNPHAVVLVDRIKDFDIQKLGQAIQCHPRFSNQVNVGFMEIINKQEIRLRVYERGVGETLSCGTGACAAVASGIRRGLVNSPVQVHMKGGTLSVDWDKSLSMTGPATFVFDGYVKVNDLISFTSSRF